MLFAFNVSINIFIINFQIYSSFIGLVISTAPTSNSKHNFWQNQFKKGANVFNRNVTTDLVKAASGYRIGFVRLAPDKFETNYKDFLIGNADNYQELIPEDLNHLKNILDNFHKEKIPIVLTMLSLPGSRWKQLNNDTDDLRLWTSVDFRKQAAKFWQDLAKELKNHPGIVGYDILNEPHPERMYMKDQANLNISRSDRNVQTEIQNVLFNFYNLTVNSIREVDLETPIVLESSNYADPKALEKLQPMADDNLLYSFHMYEPFQYTNQEQNQGKYTYPGYASMSPTECLTCPAELQYWDKLKVKDYLSAVARFQEKHDIPSSRILAGEFGGHRTSKGLEFYFQDLIDIFHKHQWHHAVYAFREDVWDGMDYEFGDKKIPFHKLQAILEGKEEMVNHYLNNSVFNILKENWSN